MDGPDVVGIQSGAMASVLVAVAELAVLLMSAAAVAIFIAWIGAIVNTADLPSKTWLVVELVLGLRGFAFVAVLAYVIGKPGRAGPPRPVGPAPTVSTNDKTPSLSGTRSQSRPSQRGRSCGSFSAARCRWASLHAIGWVFG
jgi:hypothetical protein